MHNRIDPAVLAHARGALDRAGKAAPNMFSGLAATSTQPGTAIRRTKSGATFVENDALEAAAARALAADTTGPAAEWIDAQVRDVRGTDREPAHRLMAAQTLIEYALGAGT